MDKEKKYKTFGEYFITDDYPKTEEEKQEYKEFEDIFNNGQLYYYGDYFKCSEESYNLFKQTKELEGRFINFHTKNKNKINEIFTWKNYKLDGLYRSFYENGQLKNKAYYKDGKYDGDVITYYKNGNVKTLKIYNNGKMILSNKYGDGEYELKKVKDKIESNQKTDENISIDDYNYNL